MSFTKRLQMLGPDEVQRTDTVQQTGNGPKHPFSDFCVADPDRESYF